MKRNARKIHSNKKGGLSTLNKGSVPQRRIEVVDGEELKLEMLFTNFQIQDKMSVVATKIFNDYSKEMQEEREEFSLTLLGVANGSLPATMELMEKLSRTQLVDHIRYDLLGGASRNKQKPGEFQLRFAPKKSLNGQHVLLVEDIIDKGTTIESVRKFLGEKFPKMKSYKEFALLWRKMSPGNSRPDYFCFELEDMNFVAGYGLDYSERFRALPDVWKILNKFAA